ncbi:structural maintenance of chromosomes 6 [Danaus plexippus plexippus]|uniref:Structural maintenance of chromosomes 6 n=1 Tax=Danaus plexippus plexippus TaxID=278856 RepID=A0A212EMJ6_DANPL|nr:structural maintenance of chromosomes 6 [Danaus plexippus plexippus]
MYRDIAEEDIDGLVLSIHLENFFCHDNFYINFDDHRNKNIHSVVGRNGSGKSAVLTALIVGLGGRASATSRGNNLKSFIKEGKTQATIEIKIKNSSPRAYKPEIYGDSITIVRTITSTGGGYKFKNSQGVVKSTKGSDINAITLFHDIQVDNPISVLNQDDARTLHGKDGKKKYTLFRKATHFDQTEAYYDKALENCNKANSIWKRKNEAFEKLSKEHERLTRLYNQLKPKEEIEAQKKAIQDEIKWWDIREIEKEVKIIQTKCSEERANCQNNTEKLRSLEEKYGGGNSQVELLKQQLTEREARHRELLREVREAETALRMANESLQSERQAHAQIKTRRSREQGQVADLEREIQKICVHGENDSASRREALKRELQERQVELREASSRHETVAHEETQAAQNANRAVDEYDDFRRQTSELQAKMEKLSVSVRELKEQSTDSLAVFGATMVEFCARVRTEVQNGQFTAEPRGPIGSFVKVKDKRWAGALEHLLDGCMYNFCVNEPRDSKRLFKLMDEVWKDRGGRKPGVTCSAFRPQVHDVSARRVSAPGAVCALDALEIDDVVVANYLIDNLDLETVLLVPTHDDAVRLCVSAENVPANCYKVVTADCSEYMPAPRYRIYGGKERTPHFLSTSIGDRTRQLGEKIEELKTTLSERRAEEERLAAAKESARKLQEQAAAQLHALQSKLRQCERRVAETKEALEEQAAPRRAVLEEEYEKYKEKIKCLDEKLQAMEEKIRVCGKEKEEAGGRLAQVRAEFNEIDAEYKKLKDKLMQKELEIENGQTKKMSFELRVKEGQKKLEELENALAQSKNVLEQQTQGLSDRPQQLRSKSELQNQLREIEQKLSALDSNRLPSRKKVHADLVAVTKRKNFVETELKTLKDLIKEV